MVSDDLLLSILDFQMNNVEYTDRSLFVLFQTYKAFLPAMIANNHGHLVSIASSAGLIGVNGLAGVYCPLHLVMHVINSVTALGLGNMA